MASSPRMSPRTVRVRMRRDCHPNVFKAAFGATTPPTAAPARRLGPRPSPLRAARTRRRDEEDSKQFKQKIVASAPPGYIRDVCRVLEMRPIHNRTLDIADADGDGQIDTNWKDAENHDRHFCTAPVLSPPGRAAFSQALFPGAEKLYVVQNPHRKLVRLDLGIPHSPAWTPVSPRDRRKRISAPPGLIDIAPTGKNKGHTGHMKILTDIVMSKQRTRIERCRKYKPFRTMFGIGGEAARSHPSHFQGLRAIETRTKIAKSPTHSQQWIGPPRHTIDKFYSAHWNSFLDK